MARVPDIATEVSADGVLSITVAGFKPIVVDPATYTEATRRHAMAHGFKQKYVDAAALGAEASLGEKYEAIMAIVTHHREGGAWNRAGGAGDGTSGDGLLVKAVQQAFGLDRETARGQVKGWDKKTQAAMRAVPEIKAEIDKIKAAGDKRTAGAVDTSSALAALRGMAKG